MFAPAMASRSRDGIEPFSRSSRARRADRRVGGLAAGGLTADAVDDDEQAACGVDVEAVLVDLAAQAGIGVAGGVQRPDRVHGAAHHRSGELEEHGFGEADPGVVGQGRLGAVLAPRAVHVVVAARHVAAVQGGPEQAEVDEEELSRRQVAPDARVLARDVRRRGDADVDGKRDAAAADRHGVLGHVERVAPGRIFVLDAREDVRRRGRDGGRPARGSSSASPRARW